MFQVFLFRLLGGKTKIMRHSPIEWAFYCIVCIAFKSPVQPVSGVLKVLLCMYLVFDFLCFLDFLLVMWPFSLMEFWQSRLQSIWRVAKSASVKNCVPVLVKISVGNAVIILKKYVLAAKETTEQFLKLVNITKQNLNLLKWKLSRIQLKRTKRVAKNPCNFSFFVSCVSSFPLTNALLFRLVLFRPVLARCCSQRGVQTLYGFSKSSSSDSKNFFNFGFLLGWHHKWGCFRVFMA